MRIRTPSDCNDGAFTNPRERNPDKRIDVNSKINETKKN
jgi:hypothetical protein